MKFSFRYFATFLLIFAIIILIALFVHDQIIRPYIGDVIVEWLLYCFVRSFISSRFALPLYIFLFSVAVEIMQYVHIVSLLHLEKVRLARVIIGTSFSFIDIGCYFVGCVFLVGWQLFEGRAQKKKGREQIK